MTGVGEVDPHGLASRWFVRSNQAVASPSRDSLFIHDFVRVDMPFEELIKRFTNYLMNDAIARLLLEAWTSETSEIGRQIPEVEAPSPGVAVKVDIGPPRARADALVLPIVWHSAGEEWVPPLEADLEIVAFGANRAHLHILGLSKLPPGTVACSDQASLEHRLTVAVVRHVLVQLADELVHEALVEPQANGSRNR